MNRVERPYRGLLLGVLCALSLVATAHAESDLNYSNDGGKEDQIQEREEEGRVYDPITKDHSAYERTNNGSGDPVSDISCFGDICKKDKIDPSRAAGRKAINIVPLGPDAKVIDSQSYYAALNDSLSKRAVILATTISAAEPGIADPWLKVNSDAKLQNELLFGAAAAMGEQARQNPEFEQIINENYWGCVGLETARTGNSAEALQLCASEDRPFNLGDHPDSPVRTGIGDEGEPDKNVLYVSDLLFSRVTKYYQDIVDGHGDEGAPQNRTEAREAVEYLKDIKARFIDRIGDVRYITKKANVEEGGTDTEGESEGSIIMETQVIPPANPRYELMSRQRQVTREVFAALNDVMTRYCMAINRFDNASSLSDYYNPFGIENADFWATVTKKDIIALSTMRWGFSSHVGDLLYRLVDRDSSLKSSGGAEGVTYTTDCAKLGPTSAEEAKKYIDELLRNENRPGYLVNDRIRTWLWLSIKIARGQILGEFFEMQRLLGALSSYGRIENTAAQNAHQLLLRAAGLEKGATIEGALQVNTEHIDNQVQALNKRAARSTGSRAALFGELLNHKAAGQIDSSSNPYGD